MKFLGGILEEIQIAGVPIETYFLGVSGNDFGVFASVLKACVKVRPENQPCDFGSVSHH